MIYFLIVGAIVAVIYFQPNYILYTIIPKIKEKLFEYITFKPLEPSTPTEEETQLLNDSKIKSNLKLFDKLPISYIVFENKDDLGSVIIGTDKNKTKILFILKIVYDANAKIYKMTINRDQKEHVLQKIKIIKLSFYEKLLILEIDLSTRNETILRIELTEDVAEIYINRPNSVDNDSCKYVTL